MREKEKRVSRFTRILNSELMLLDRVYDLRTDAVDFDACSSPLILIGREGRN